MLTPCVGRCLRTNVQGNILSNENFSPVIAFSFIPLSQNEQRKIIVALSQDGGGGLGKSAGRYYGLERESSAAQGGRESR